MDTTHLKTNPKEGTVDMRSILFCLVLLLFAVQASAADRATPQAGGCFASGRACAGPSAAITVASYNLATSQFSGGISPGLGYGVTYAPDQWYAVGLDLYASLRLGQGQPNQATFSLMGHFANYVFLGVGPSITQRDSGQPALVQWSILGGLGIPIGGSTGYVQSQVRATRGAPVSIPEYVQSQVRATRGAPVSIPEPAATRKEEP
jgi:hypothetical protein